MTDVKICGIRTPEILHLAAREGARFAGLVFVPHSPRYLTLEAAQNLAQSKPQGIELVGLFADPEDEILERAITSLKLQHIQLHGHESPARVQAIKSRYDVRVIKAIPVATKEDLTICNDYINCVDWLLFDAKTAGGTGTLTGGNGQVFDWTILKNIQFPKPWMLSGGLTPDNVADALAILTPDAVDVSSGVESTKGVKDPEKIRKFLAEVRAKG